MSVLSPWLLRGCKKDLVEAAVEFYLNAWREEMQAGPRELLGQLDGSRAARVALLADKTRNVLDCTDPADAWAVPAGILAALVDT